MTNKKEDYNGWSNRETWLASLWLDQYQSEAKTAEDIKDLFESEVEHVADMTKADNGMFSIDLMRGALENINWQEIADSKKAL